MVRIGNAALVLVLATLMGSCGGASDSESGAAAAVGADAIAPVSHVENGVTVLEHDAGALERAPHVSMDAVPMATMGGTGGDVAYDLTWANYVVLLPAGRLAALAAVGNRFMLFAADGRGLRSWGRTGKGPGDLMAPGGLVPYRGDTLLIPDRANQRVNFVLPDRGIVGTRSVAVSVKAYVSNPAGVLPDGQLVMHAAGWFGMNRDTLGRTLAPLAVVGDADSTVRKIADVRDLEVGMLETRYRGRRRTERHPLRLGRAAYVVVWDSLIAVAEGDAYRIDLLTAKGVRAARLNVAQPRRAVTQTMRDAHIAFELDRFNNRGGGESMVDPAESRRLIFETPFADTLPPFNALFVTSEGLLWAVDIIAPGDSSWSATAFRRDGAIVGRLHASGVDTPVAFGADRVVLRHTDIDGVVSLRVHAMRWQRRAT